MRSIIVGFADDRGRAEPKIVCGPEVPDAKQAALIADAKRNHKFPKGFARLECLFFDDSRKVIAIKIGAEPGEKTK